MPVRFDGEDKKIYWLTWTELLRVDGTPFDGLEELEVGVNLQAPYTAGASASVLFWPAEVVKKGICHFAWEFFA